MDTLAIVGLLLSFFGTVTLAIFGVPQPDLSDPPTHTVLSVGPYDGYEAAKAAVEAKRMTHNFRARFGLIAIGIGFLLQLASYL